MRKQKYRLPPLDLFRSFEAVARHQSFTRAADELCLTQSAVSRQIRQLEEGCGARLFTRLHRRIELTPEGQMLWAAVTQGLDAIAGCIGTFQPAPAYPQITVSASISFAYFWLMPRLEIFNEAHPDVDIRVLASDQKVDLRHQEVDIAILYGEAAARTDGVVANLLFEEEVYPICSAGFLQTHSGLEGAADLVDQTLLHLDGGGNLWGAVDWPVWLASQGVRDRPSRQGIRLNTYPMVIQAAQAGRGIALGWSYIVDEMIRDGSLVRPLAGSLQTHEGYYVGALEDKLSVPANTAFMNWISEEFQRV